MGELLGTSVGRWAGKRGLSTPMAAVVMIVVILVVGGLGYVGLNSSNNAGSTSTSTVPSTVVTCFPTNNPNCVKGAVAHDVSLAVPFKAVQQNNVVPFTATLPPGETATSYSFNFGDGATVNDQTSPTASHSYAGTGKYIAWANASVNGAVHDSLYGLVVLTVTTSYGSASAGNVPSVAGTIVSNSTPGTGSPTAILQPGGSVTLMGTYTSAPTNPLFSLQAPTWGALPTGATVSNPVNTNSSAEGTFTFATAGTYWVSFVGSATSTGSGTAYQNYTWTVVVAGGGVHGGVAGTSSSSSPHKGSLNVYELVPGGSGSEDPSLDYETAGYEPIQNVYETLINYNGSQTGPTFTSYVPTIATCVPGSDVGANNCNSLYGNTLITGTDYTFVVSSTPQFYDPATGNHWGVYPTDVVFSVARTMAFSTNPCAGCNNGWILTQALLAPGNGAWDSLHGPYNNTPQNIWNSMTINGTDCPAAAMTNDHGCVTFHANAGGKNWPYFLELIADPLGGSIVPCGWFSASPQSAGIPYWTYGNVSGNGDHPCAVPGSAGYGVDWSTISPTAWDAYELAGSAPPYWGNVQFAMAGSGPYYMANFVQATSYTLAANPDYAANPYCSWSWCWPAAGHYAGNVSVVWETSQVPGEQAYAAGVADFASVPSTDVAFLLQLIQAGKISATTFPTIDIDFYPFNFAFNLAGAQHYTSNPITVPQDWFSHVAMRQFFAHTYPYATIQQTINTKSGIQYAFGYGGAIPQFMANYYPTNVSWPTGDPVTDASVQGSAAWWWAQATTTSSPFYDAEAAACSTSNPCELPLFGQTGAPDLDQRIALWASQINSVSGGKVIASPLDINFIDAVINSLYSGAYANPMPVFRLGWAPDYPDPTDYVAPLYQADGTYTLGDAVWEQTQLAAFNAGSCHMASDYTWWSNQAQTSGVPDNCQGAAYASLQAAMAAAAVMPAGPQRVLTYAEAEQIANALALYVYSFQTNVVLSTASWIDPTTYNTNITSGGGGDSAWYTIGGNGVW
jgi:hypothetical protein